ncbi:MAG: type II secretion system F family protein [Acidimicrobiales bacterium]
MSSIASLLPLLAGVGAAVVVARAAHAAVRPRPALGRRLGPYLTGAPLPWWDAADAAALVGRPHSTQPVWSLRSTIELRQTVEQRRRRRLVEAGERAADWSTSLRRQTLTAVAGAAVGGLLGLVVVGSPMAAVLLAALGVVAGGSREAGRIERRRSERALVMEADAPRIAELLAAHLRAGHGVAEANRLVVAERPGPLAAEVRRVAAAVGSGVDAGDAWAALARRVPDAGTARLARAVAASSRATGDLAPTLVALAIDLRAQRRHAVARRAVRRRTAMVAPLLLCIAPVMALYVAAALPRLVLGQ